MAARIARRWSSAVSSSRRHCPARVSIVYGTFCNGSSRLDAQAIAASATASRLRFRVNVEDGAAFNFDGLRDTEFLLVSTSSWLGMPPANLADFAQQLLLAAETHPGCLAHLQASYLVITRRDGADCTRLVYLPRPCFLWLSLL